LLLSQLASELGAGTASARLSDRVDLTVTTRSDPRDTGVWSRIADDPRPDPSLTPAIPPPPPQRSPRAGWPDLTPGAAEELPGNRWFPGTSLVITGGMPWPR
ncbi:MAG: hypothetical protein ACRDRA_03745, partial [Pseudonocardiaceae bacterium]